MRAVIQALPDIMIHLDEQGTILDIKADNNAVTWLSRRKYIGKHVEDFPYLKLSKNYQNIREQLQNTPDLLSFDHKVVRDRQTDHYEIRCIPALKNQIIVLARNISAIRSAEANLQRSISLLQATLDSTSNGILVVSRAGSILEFNRRFLKLWGITDNYFNSGISNEVLQSITAPLAKPEVFLERFLDIKNAVSAVRYENIVFNDGKILEWYSMPQFHDNQHLGCVWSFTDVTQLKQTEEAQRRQNEFLRKIIDGNPNLIFVKDWEGRFTLANKAMAKVFDAEPEDLIGRFDAEISTDSEQVEAFLESDRKVMRTRKSLFVAEQAVKDQITGEKRWYQTTKLPLISENGECREVLGISTDITERKTYEDKLAKLVVKLEEVNRTKDQFLANMSHEVRTPMNGVYGMIDLLLETNLTTEQREYLITARSSAEDMLVIINDILDFSKIEAGKLLLEQSSFDLHELITRVVKQLVPNAHAKDLEVCYWIDKAVPQTVIGDAGRLKQVLVNLLGNAIKFTDAGHVVAKIDAIDHQPGKVSLKFDVTDSGIGIKPEKTRIIFEAFSQVDGSMTRKYDGTGLGLTISSQLVKAMSGEIWVTSPAEPVEFYSGTSFTLNTDDTGGKSGQNGPGTTFSFTATLKTPEAPARKAAVTEESPFGGMKALIATANVTSGKLLGSMFAREGFRPTVVTSGAAGLELALFAAKSAAPFHLILSDIHLPDMIELQFAEQVRNSADLHDIPIILLGLTGQRVDPEAQKRLKITSVMTRPVSYAELCSAVSKSQGMGCQLDSQGLASAGHDNANLPQLKILLAEDNPINQKLALRLLNKMGHQVEVVGNGKDAVKKLYQMPFDLVLMDIHMPTMDGFEATRRIRAREAGTDRQTPIIALTANAMKGDREKCLQAGMNEYVSKPIRKDDLLTAIKQVSSRTKSLH